jgi:hypothetical protein
MAERSEEDLVLGILRITVGEGIVKMVPTLKVNYIEEWAKLLVSEGDSAKPLGEWSMADVAALTGRSVQKLLDLVVAYDRTGALGGREWLGENADAQQLYAAVVQMVGNVHPLADDPAALVGLMVLRSAAPSALPNSTNGSSTNGASRPHRSVRRSTRSK